MHVNRKLDTASSIALSGIFLGWFFVDTLVVTLGALQHGIRFFDLPVVIADPTRIFFGIEKTFRTFLFGAVCLVCLLLPFTVYWRQQRWTWLAHCAPLLLMLICGLLLVVRTSAEFFAAPVDTARVGGAVIRLANGWVHRGSGVVGRHITVGVGGYAAFLASIVLAGCGLVGFRRQRVSAP